MAKKSLRKYVWCFLALGLLAGCGSGTPSSSSSSSQTSSSSSSSSKTSSSSSSSSSKSALQDPKLAWKEGYSLAKTYDGTPVLAPTASNYTTSSNGEITIVWKSGDSVLDKAPSDAGSYEVVLTVSATNTFEKGTINKLFAIAKAALTVSFPDGYSPDKKYDGQPATAPTVQEGESIEWYEGETKLVSAPTDAGFYSVKIVNEGDANHEKAEASLDFTIRKADGSIAFPDGYSPSKTYDGKPVEAPTIPEGSTIEWKQGDSVLGEAPTNVGSYSVSIHTPASKNFTAASASIDFSIAKADGSLEFSADYKPSKVYDAAPMKEPAATDYLTNSDGAITTEWYEGDSKLLNPPSMPGAYTMKIAAPDTDNVSGDTASLAFSISQYTTSIFGTGTNATITMAADGEAALSLTKGENGELIASGWWVNLDISGVTIPLGATAMVLHIKADSAITDTEYNYSYPGVSLGSGVDLDIGTEYTDVSLPLAKNNCPLARLAILAPNNRITISAVSFTIPTSKIPEGKTGIFTHLGTSYPDVTTEAFRGSSACSFYNSAADDALVMGGEWWDEVIFNGTTGVAIPSGSTKMTLRMKGSAGFSCLYVLSGTPANFAYDESKGFAVTTSYQDFEVNLNGATMVNSFGFCTANNYLTIASVLFS